MTAKRIHRLLMIAILALAFIYQLARPSFPNDHFDHLSKARQMLHGEYPVRDFFDPGRPLTIGLSAVALSLSHDTLFGEAMLTMTAIAIAVMLVYWLTWRLTGSGLWGGWAAGCALAIEPRLYNYPKVLVCTVAFWLATRYLDAPSRTRALCLGVWGGVGFLFRHDLGVYLAATAGAALLSTRARGSGHAARDALVMAAAALAATLPYIVYLQGIGALSSVAQEGAGGLLSTATVTWRPFVGPGSNTTPWLRHNAENWIYYLFLLAPLIAIAARLSGRLAAAAADQVFTLAVLCAMLMLFLIRGNLDSRLPDVAAPSFILVAWTLATGAGWFGTVRPRWRIAAHAAAILCAVVTALSVEQLAEWQAARRLARTFVRLPTSLSEPIALLQRDPLEAWEREGTTDVRGLARWMRACTGPDDRFLVFGYHPEVFFYSQRLFAGGMPFFHAGYFSNPDEQQLTVARLGDQRVPFVVIEDTVLPALDGTYAIVGAYIRQHYTIAGESSFGGERLFHIFRHATFRPRQSREGLPCLIT